eukprot:s3606_g17.t2
MPLLLLMMMVLVMMMIEDCQDVVMMWAYVGVALVEMRMVVMSFTRYYDDDVQDAESCGGPDEDDVMATMTVFSILIMMMMTPMTTMVIIMAVAFTPAALAGSGHPELAPLLFVPPALAAFLGCLKLLGRDESLIEEGSIALASMLCLGLSLSSVAVLGSYPFLLWSVLPGLAAFCPRPLRSVSVVVAFALPWLLHLQFLVLGLDLLCPLTYRSGTSIPGDVVVAAFFGLMTGLFLSLSARFILCLQLKLWQSGGWEIPASFLWR